jgi:ATP:ADP antiporter, AAA family
MSHDKGFLDLFLSVQKGERTITALLFTWIFLFICVYYILRPIRRGLFLAGLGNEYMPLVYIGTALVTGVVVWLYSKFSKAPRKILISSVYGIFIVNLLAWWQIFKHESPVASGAFWVWLDVFSIMGVTLFWMYANDVCDSNKAKRLFGVIAAGGGLGAVLGSTITACLVGTIGTTNLLLVAAGFVALTLGLFHVLEALNKKKNVVERAAAPEFEKAKVSSISGAFKLIFQNKFLLLLLFVVALERVTPDMVQFLYNDILKSMATGRDAIAAVDANLERWRGIVEFVVELFLVSAIVRKLGSGFCLSSSAGLIFAGVTMFAFVPNPLILMAVFHGDEAMRHAWFKAAKELMYTVTSRDVLYNVKPVIEMFVYRMARGVAGVIIFIVNTALGLGAKGVMAAAVICAAGWLFCGWKLSKEYSRLEMEATRRALEAQLGEGSLVGKSIPTENSIQDKTIAGKA